MNFSSSMLQLLKAGNPMLVVNTYEEDRAFEDIRAIVSKPGSFKTPRKLWTWACTTGLVDAQSGVDLATKDVRVMLDRLAMANEAGVYVLKDMHVHFGVDGGRPDAYVIRALRDIVSRNRHTSTPITVVLLMPRLLVPWDLRKSVTVIDFALPNATEITALLDSMVTANSRDGRVRSSMSIEDKSELVAAAAGLTIAEAENALALAMVSDGALSREDVVSIREYKQQAVRTGGVLDVIDSPTDMEDVGGLENLKHWLGLRRDAWLPPASEYAVPAPRGLLMTGVPGCGKSMTAMAVATEWRLPLLRLDLGRVMSGIVGSSEQNMRSALQTAEAIAPCVLWIDEIDKGFAGIGTALDSGVTRRVFGTFLTWMQERAAPVFVIATANSVERLPPEFLRKGRFDEIFFVDLPTTAERLPIWRTHIGKRFADGPSIRGALELDEPTLTRLADMSEGYSGAEIEQCVVNALYECFAAESPLKATDLHHTITNMVPLASTQEGEISALREWASTRAVAATSAADTGEEYVRGAPPKLHPEDSLERGGRVVDY